MQKHGQLVIIFLLSSAFSYADSQVYQSLDKNGNTVVGNIPGGQVMQLPPLTVIPAKQMNTQQSSKDLKRRQILQEELNKEQKALNDVKNLLDQSIKMKSQDSTQLDIFHDAINEHQKNIDILTKQLGN